MKKKELMIIIVAFLVIVIPILINEYTMRPKLKLVNDVKEILENIKRNNFNSAYTEEVIIKDKYKLGNKVYYIKGNGVIFLEDNASVMLSRDGMCAMKLPFSENIMFQKEECPTYKLLNGIKTPIKASDEGLYKKGNEYVYVGKNVSNYISFNDELWRIVSLDGKNIKIMKTKAEQFKYKNRIDLYTKLEEKYKSLITKYSKYLVKTKWEIGSVEFETNDILIKEKTVESYIGIISTDMYINSLEIYEIGENKVIALSESYLTKEMLLSNENTYLNKRNIVYTNSDIYGLDLHSVIILNEKVVVTKGSGTQNDPYIINMETE